MNDLEKIVRLTGEWSNGTDKSVTLNNNDVVFHLTVVNGAYTRRQYRTKRDRLRQEWIMLRNQCGDVPIFHKWLRAGLDTPPANKYHRTIPGTTTQVDVYDVLLAYNVTCPALQHLIKKALCAGLRGHKDQSQDLQDIIDSAKRAKELYDASKRS